MWHILYPQEGAVRHLCCSQFQVNRCTAERSSDVNLIPMAHRWDDLEVMENWISSQLQTSTDMMAKRTDTRKAWAGPFGGDEPHQACQIRTGKACRKGAIKSIILLEVGGGGGVETCKTVSNEIAHRFRWDSVLETVMEKYWRKTKEEIPGRS